MKVLLGSPRRSAFTGESISAPHVGLLSLASVVRESTFHDLAGVEVQVVDDQLDLLLDPACPPGSCLRGHSPDIFGVQAVTSGIKNAVNLIALCRAQNPKVLTVIGGVGATQKAESLVESGAVDVVVHGEGELTFSELIYRYGQSGRAALREVAGISFRDDDGAVMKTAARAPIEPLDLLPLPARYLVDIPTYQRVSRGRSGIIVTSRGCSFACAYCYSRHQWGVGQRRFSVARVIAEIRSMHEELHLDRIRIEDDDFLEDRAWVLEFCRAMEETGLSGRLEWEAKGRPEQCDDEMVGAIRRASCFRILTGVETLDDALLKRLNRQTKADTVERALDCLSRHGVAAQATMILGIPGEAIGAIRKTLSWLDARMGGRDIIGACFFAPFDGVDGVMARRLDYRIEVPDTDCFTGHIPVTSSPACSYPELWRLYEDMGTTRRGSFKRTAYLASMQDVQRRIHADH